MQKNCSSFLLDDDRSAFVLILVRDPNPNAYSRQWFASFHVPITDSRTIPEVDFICGFAPLPEFPRVLDVCCGMGQHARELSRRGYLVTGVDRDAMIIAKARDLGGGPQYVQADLREYQPQLAAFDVAIIMGQSFGHFDTAVNRAVLDRLAIATRKGGRVILDLWNPDFFASRQGHRDFHLPNGVVRETKAVRDGRLFVHLRYPDGEQENFEWQLFSPTEMESMATQASLALIACCADFDPKADLCASTPRLQFVLEHTA